MGKSAVKDKCRTSDIGMSWTSQKKLGITPGNKGDPMIKSRLIPIPQWGDFHPWPTANGLRNLIARAKRDKNENGFRNVIVRIGRRIMIDEEKFFKWANKRSET